MSSPQPPHLALRVPVCSMMCVQGIPAGSALWVQVQILQVRPTSASSIAFWDGTQAPASHKGPSGDMGGRQNSSLALSQNDWLRVTGTQGPAGLYCEKSPLCDSKVVWSEKHSPQLTGVNLPTPSGVRWSGTPAKWMFEYRFQPGPQLSFPWLSNLDKY